MTALDTNVFIYACDKSEPERQKKALDLIDRVTDGVLPWQVACEFIAASRKLREQGFTPEDAWARLTDFRQLFRLVVPSSAVLPAAQNLHLKHNVSFWDALIVAACLDEGVGTLYSEDIPSREEFGLLRVVNPFA
jgi:predicted nucleic acid-binding protein